MRVYDWDPIRAGALWPAASTAAQTGRTRDRTRPMLQVCQKVLAKAPSTRDPKRKSSGIICCDAHEPTFDVLGCHPWVSGRLMRRRVFITLLGGATAWPFAARGQQFIKVFKVGFIATGGVPLYTNAFHDALQNLGWIEGKNVVYESRYAENRLDRLPELAAELLRLNVDVIVAGGTPAPLAAKRATASVPIVMTG